MIPSTSVPTLLSVFEPSVKITRELFLNFGIFPAFSGMEYRVEVSFKDIDNVVME